MAWKYQELIDSFYEDLLMYQEQYNQSISESVSRVYGEFYSEVNSDEMEKTLIMVLYAEITAKQVRTYYVSKEKIIQGLETVDFEKIREQITNGQLTEKQLEELRIRRDKALVELEKMQVDMCPYARWFYGEVTTEVNKCFANVEGIMNERKAKEIIADILDRFARESKRISSVKMTVYVTIAENLLKYGMEIPDSIQKQLQEIDVNHTEQQFTDDERLDLLQRLQNINCKY